MKKSSKHNAGMFALSLAALGVVFGDIGTSPLYAMREVFTIGNNILELNAMNVLGVLSIIFWALILVVSVKYILFIMHANNHGEGGIMALLSLATKNFYCLDWNAGCLHVLCRRHDYPCYFSDVSD